MALTIVTLTLITMWLAAGPNEPAIAAQAPAGSTPPDPAALATAPRVTGLITVEARSERNTRSPKLVVARCPEGKQILGGAGSVDGVGGRGAHTILTSRRPTDDYSGHGHGYAITAVLLMVGDRLDNGEVTAHAWDLLPTPDPWILEIQAICV